MKQIPTFRIHLFSDVRWSPVRATLRLVLPVIAAGTAGCVSTARPALQPAAPSFDPIAFFAGRTEGRGMLKVAFRGPVPTLVEGTGMVNSSGQITLDQSVRRGSRPPTSRSWHLSRVGPDRYAGTLSDAAGPVRGEVRRGRLHLRFRMAGGLIADQWLVLDNGGLTARNVLLIAKFGLPVARLDETITRLP